MLVLDELYHVHIPNNMLPHNAFAELVANATVSEKAKQVLWSMGNWRDTNNNPWKIWQMDKYQWEDGESYSGKWSTRFEKLYRKITGEKIALDEFQFISEFMGRYTKELDVVFRRTPIFDWQPGDFAERDGGSCWWTGDGKVSRIGLASREYASVLLFYRDEDQYKEHAGKKGIARSWIVEQNGYMVLFNAYGIPLDIQAAALAEKFNFKTRKATIHSPHAFLNQGNWNNYMRQGGEDGIGYLVGNDIPESETVEIPDFTTRNTTCPRCKRACRPSNLGFQKDGLMCDACAENLYPSCTRCGLMSKDEYLDITRSGLPRKICRECADYIGIEAEDHQCVVHGATYERTTRAYHTPRRYCPKCVGDGHAIECRKCGKFVDDYTVLAIIGDYRVCIPCSKIAIKNLKEKRNGYIHQLRPVQK